MFHYLTLDDFKGSGRNHDLIVVGSANGKKTLIAVEAKVDESFGDIVADYVSKSVKANPRSKVPERVQKLSSAIFGSTNVGTLRYQLIHAVAGTLIEAKNQDAAQAVLVIHEFVPISGKSDKAIQNEKDYSSFIQIITNNLQSSKTGMIIGTLSVPGGGRVPFDIPLFIGKIESSIF